MVSIPAEDPGLRLDRWLRGHSVHLTSHLLFCAYKHFSYDPPIWMDEGLAHALEREVEPASTTIDTDEGAEAPPATATAQPKKHKSRSRRSATGRQTKTEAPPACVRPGTKQALLIDLLRRKDGATIGEIVDATGWQPHSVRGAISGTLKKKLGLTVERAVVDDRGRVYRIVGRG